MIKYSELLKEVLNLYPEEIPCDDAKTIGNEGMKWYSLHDLHDKIDEENNYFKEGNELYSALLWSILVGIIEGFRKQYAEKDKLCTTVKILEIIDYLRTKEHFKQSINDEEWQNYLKEINEEIIFD